MFRQMMMAKAANAKPIGLISTIRITQDDAISDPSQIITRLTDRKAIDWIRANSHCYVTQDGSTGTNLIVKQLSDSTRKQYADGSDASEDIKVKDVFMKLPQFWWCCKETEEGSDIWDISFSTSKQKDWHEWEGDTFIGAYKAHNDDNGCPCSISGAFMTVTVSQNAFKTGCATKGTNYHLVSYEAHQIMCLLFYAYYANTNAQAVCGSGYNTAYTTGASDNIGMEDTPASGMAFVNFWGLEQWWGGTWEWIDNVVTLGGGKVGIKELGTPSTTADIKREVQVINGGTNIKSLVFGVNGDILPKTAGDNYRQYFADLGSVLDGAGRVGRQSGVGSSVISGVACLDVSSGPGEANNLIGSRLLYKGAYSIIK